MNKNDLEQLEPIADQHKGLFDKRPLAAIGGWMWFCLAVLTVGYYIVFPAKGEFHSDCADTIFWAQAAYDGGSLLNPDFHYACFLPIGGQLLMLPFIPLFGVSMTTHTLGMLLFLALFAAALVFLFRQLTRSTAFSTVAAGSVLLILSGSEKLREIFYGHVIYYSLGILFLVVGLGLVFRLMRLQNEGRLRKPSGRVTLSLLCVWCLLGAINQFEILTLFSLPLIGGMIAERFFDFSHTLSFKCTLSVWKIVSGMIAATALGYMIGSLLVGDMHAGYAEAFSSFSDPETWFDNLSKFLLHYTTLFGTTAAYGLPFGSADGFFELIRIIASLVVLVVPIVATVLYTKWHDRMLQVLIWAHWILTALIMMGFVFGHLSIANWRLSPMLCTSVIVTLASCYGAFKRFASRRRLLLIAAVPIGMVLIYNMFTVISLPPNYKQDEELYAIVDTMTENGWTHGYATFWNAGKLTVISDSEITCRNVEISAYGDSIEKYDYQSNVRWFEEEHEQYFLLVDTAEYARMVTAGNPLVTDALETHTLHDAYVVMLFNENIV